MFNRLKTGWDGLDQQLAAWVCHGGNYSNGTMGGLTWQVHGQSGIKSAGLAATRGISKHRRRLGRTSGNVQDY
jgi:hypothetical protein